jgi:hypothetical protein
MLGVGMLRAWRLVAAAAVAVSALAVGTASPAGAVSSARPLISSVAFSGAPGDYTVVVRGHKLGGPTVALPYVGDVTNFRIGDDAQPGQEWGYAGDVHPLQYLVWTPSKVEVSGLVAAPGDALVVGVWNAVTGRGATWGGNVPPVVTASPTITALGFSSLGTPVDLRIVVKGTGFGAPPRPMPFIGDLDTFSFWDGRSHCGASTAFSAGGDYFGVAPADTVTLRYESWSDTKIVISGFRGSYGSGCSKLETGDPVAVSVWNTGDTSVTGPQAARRGIILYGTPGN